MSTRDPSGPATPGDTRRAASELERREREARALRENLLRRKAQARARRDGVPAGTAPAEDVPGEGR